MAGLPEVIGLLYRADWTRLSLSAEVRSETDRNLLPPLSPDEPSRWYRPGRRRRKRRSGPAGTAPGRRSSKTAATRGAGRC